MRKLRVAAVALGVAAVITTAAYAAGYFPYFPVIGGATYCSSVAGTGVGGGTSTPAAGTFPTGQPPANFAQGNPVGVVPGGSFAINCNSFVPPGPPSTTGFETFPVDTNLPNGQQPQTALLSTRLVGAGATQYQIPLTGAALTVAFNETTLLLEPAGTLATLSVTLPTLASGLIDGQTWRIATTQTITALTLTAGTGTTIATGCTAITISTIVPYGCEYQFRAATAKWYRIQ